MTNEEMFNKNINIAYKIANKYLDNYKNEYEDIKQIALLGLWKAVLTFKNTYAFSTYSYKVIFNEINHYLRNRKKAYLNEISIQNQIAEKVKTTQSAVSRLRKKIIKQCKENL